MKRKALLGANSFNQEPPLELNPPNSNLQTGPLNTENIENRSRGFTTVGGGAGNLSSVVGDMEANKVRLPSSSAIDHFCIYLTFADATHPTSRPNK